MPEPLPPAPDPTIAPVPGRTADRGPGPASRRALVAGVLGAGVAAPLLAACGSGGDGGSGGAGGSTTSTGPVTTTDQVPVGGGIVLAAEKVVVTQPTAGEFKAFTAVCPHQQCLVAKVEGEEIDCSCHGSRFSITDGSVLNGPAEEPLAELEVSVDGEDVSVSSRA